MDVLTNKVIKSYDYTCRYSAIPYYYQTLDDKYFYGLGKQVNKNVSYVAHKVVQSDTLDSLALKYYNNPTYYWVIAYFNDIQDSFIKLSDKFEIIKIPNIANIKFVEGR